MTKILDALNTLRDGGVARGELRTHDGRHCALGAVLVAYGHEHDDDWADRRDGDIRALAETAREQFADLWYDDGVNWWIDDGDCDPKRVAVTFNNLVDPASEVADMAAIETWFEKAAIRRAEEVVSSAR